MTTTIPALMRDAARQYGDRAALVSQVDGAVSFRELDHRADLIARALIADSARPGDRAAIWAPNMWEWVAAAIGIQRAGGVIVPLNTRLKGSEVGDIIRRGNIARLFTIGAFLGRNQRYFPSSPSEPDRSRDSAWRAAVRRRRGRRSQPSRGESHPP